MNKQPASLNIETLPGPQDIARKELDNGIVVLVRPNLNTLSVSLAGYLPAGSLYEPEEKLGLADFTASGLMRGTKQRSFQEIYNSLESIGASLRFSGGTHTSGFSGKSLADDLDILTEILKESLLHPTFPSQQVERIRSQLLTGLDLRAQDTGDMASLVFDQLAYQDHPYRHPGDGFPETIAAITRRDLLEFHSRQYGPRGMVIAVSGAVQPERVFQWIEDTLGSWANPDQPEEITVPPAPELSETVKRHHTIPEKSQADLVLGAPGPSRCSPDFIPARLGNNILGQFGMMGRIGDAVRSKAGLAYYAYSSVSSSIGPGPWTVSAGVNPADLDQALDLIIQEIETYVSQPVTGEELVNSKSSYIGKLPLALESNAGVASALLNLERYGLGLDYYQNYQAMINQVSAEEILEVSRKYLDPDRLAVATAGP
jgi:zinc protease